MHPLEMALLLPDTTEYVCELEGYSMFRAFNWQEALLAIYNYI